MMIISSVGVKVFTLTSFSCGLIFPIVSIIFALEVVLPRLKDIQV